MDKEPTGLEWKGQRESKEREDSRVSEVREMVVKTGQLRQT